MGVAIFYLMDVSELCRKAPSSAIELYVWACFLFQCATFFSYVWRMGEFLCIFTHYIQTVSMVCSVMTLTAMSVERYLVKVKVSRFVKRKHYFI